MKSAMIALHRLVWCVATISAVAVLACSSGSDTRSSDQYSNLMAFDSAQLRLVSGADTATLTVELAESADQHTMGLMERRAMPGNAGMLFLYSSVQPETSAFWMFRTRIPLDIAFIDSAGVIRTVQTMTPCASVLAQGCPNYPAGARYIAALEVNAGYFAGKRIRVGDRVLLQDTAARRSGTRPR
jgi:uncharacterized membrane protein (UPF0127 family)